MEGPHCHWSYKDKKIDSDSQRETVKSESINIVTRKLFFVWRQQSFIRHNPSSDAKLFHDSARISIFPFYFLFIYVTFMCKNSHLKHTLMSDRFKDSVSTAPVMVWV